MTSHDVVDEVRKATGLRRVGHAGTLDPAAAGVLPVLCGQAARLAEFLVEKDKSYRVEMVLGVVASTHDLTALPDRISDASRLSQGEVEGVARSFVGETDQIVPAFSAVQVEGRRLYRMAQRGKATPVITRRIKIISLEILSMSRGPNPRVLMDVTCSKGTYVRTLCHDIGVKLGTGAALAFLLRTRAGPFLLEDSVTLQEIASSPSRTLLPMRSALEGYPVATLSAPAARLLRSGIKPGPEGFLSLPDAREGEILVVLGPGEELVAVGALSRDGVSIKKVFPA
jgi:tRNA pseudouridine55 synthase